MAKTLSLGRDWDAICALGYAVIDRHKRSLTRDAVAVPGARVFRTRDAVAAAADCGCEDGAELTLAGINERNAAFWRGDKRVAAEDGEGTLPTRDAAPLQWGASSQDQLSGLRKLNSYFSAYWKAKR